MGVLLIVEVAEKFVERINKGDVGGILDLMTENHLFVDSLGNEVRGRDSMKKGWEGYFAMVPDYRIAVEDTLISGDVIVLLGSASGTYAVEGELLPENRWETPAAWKALVRGEEIAEWRVYADNEPLREIRRASQSSRTRKDTDEQ